MEYLQTLAISRIYLENFENVQSSWVTQGLKTCQLGLRFGGNDVGSIMIEENVVAAAGAHHRASEEELRRIIRDAGFIPKQRDTLYRTYFLELSLERTGSGARRFTSPRLMAKSQNMNIQNCLRPDALIRTLAVLHDGVFAGRRGLPWARSCKGRRGSVRGAGSPWACSPLTSLVMGMKVRFSTIRTAPLLGGEAQHAEALGLGKLEVELLLGVAEDVERMGAVRVSSVPLPETIGMGANQARTERPFLVWMLVSASLMVLVWPPSTQ